jgi:hypothetical protein
LQLNNASELLKDKLLEREESEQTDMRKLHIANDRLVQENSDLNESVAKSERELGLMQRRLDTLKTEVESLQKANKHLLLKHKEQEEGLLSSEGKAQMLERELDEVKIKLCDAERARSLAEARNISLTSELLKDFLEAEKCFNSSLNSVGAEGHRLSVDAEHFETGVFFDWLKGNIELIPSVVKGMEEYASKISFDALVQMLEKKGCEHLRSLGLRGQALPDVEAQKPTRLSKVLSNRLVVEYWQHHGFAEAQRLSLAKLAEVLDCLC